MCHIVTNLSEHWCYSFYIHHKHILSAVFQILSCRSLVPLTCMAYVSHCDKSGWALMLFFLYLSQTYSFCSVPDSFLSKSSTIDMYGLCVTLWQIWLSIDVILFIFITNIFSLQCSRALIQYKMSSYQYRKSHCEDKTILGLSNLHNGISYTGKMTSLYWIGAQVLSCWSLVILICKAYVSHCDRSVCGGPISDSQWEVVLSYPGFVPSIAVAWFHTLNLRVQQDFAGSPRTFWMMLIFFLIVFFSLNFFCQNSRGVNVKHDLFISKTVLDLLNGSHIWQVTIIAA